MKVRHADLKLRRAPRVFNLEGRRQFEQRVCDVESPWHLFLFGKGGNSYDLVNGKEVWIHGTFGDSNLSGYDGRFFAVAIERESALWRQDPTLCVVAVDEYPSVKYLMNAHPWRMSNGGEPELFTYCNWSVSFCRYMVYGRPGLQYGTWGRDLHRQWVANEMWEELAESAKHTARYGLNGRDPNWCWVSLRPGVAQDIANRGGFVIAAAQNDQGPGHVAFLVEDPHFDRWRYDLMSRDDQNPFWRIPCLHVGLGKPRRSPLGEAFMHSRFGTQSKRRDEIERVRLYCDWDTWSAYSLLGFDAGGEEGRH